MLQSRSLTKEFNFSSKILDLVIEDLNVKTNITFEEILNNTKNNLVIADTKGILLNKKLEVINSTDESKTIIVGLITEKDITTFKKRGIKQGFFRSTDVNFKCAIVISDKSKAYLFGNDKRGFEVPDKFAKQLFKLINHYIWATATCELCKGELTEIKDSRLNALMPDMCELETKGNYNKNNLATPSFEPQTGVIVKDINECANWDLGFITDQNFEGYFDEKDNFYVNILDNLFIPINKGNNIFTNRFVKKVPLKDCVGKYCLQNKNDKVAIKTDDSLTVDIKVYLDEYLDSKFTPNFDSLISMYSGVTENLKLNVNIYPYVLDSSYLKHRNYKNLEKLNSQIDDAIQALENMYISDKKAMKQIESIKTELKLFDKIKKYNKFISSQEFGLKVLNNKKKFKEISFTEKDNVVPSEIIGSLYTKEGINYLATNKSHIEDAKKWLAENNINARLIANE